MLSFPLTQLVYLGIYLMPICVVPIFFLPQNPDFHRANTYLLYPVVWVKFLNPFQGEGFRSGSDFFLGGSSLSFLIISYKLHPNLSQPGAILGNFEPSVRHVLKQLHFNHTIMKIFLSPIKCACLAIKIFHQGLGI